MAENKKIENPKLDEKVCFNCKNMLWMVGIGQGVKCKLDLKNIPSRFLYIPDEGHWVLKPQNSILWNRVFFDWLNRTLKN